MLNILVYGKKTFKICEYLRIFAKYSKCVYVNCYSNNFFLY